MDKGLWFRKRAEQMCMHDEDCDPEHCTCDWELNVNAAENHLVATWRKAAEDMRERVAILAGEWCQPRLRAAIRALPIEGPE